MITYDRKNIINNAGASKFQIDCILEKLDEEIMDTDEEGVFSEKFNFAGFSIDSWVDVTHNYCQSDDQDVPTIDNWDITIKLLTIN
jgi:hypothetical protein